VDGGVLLRGITASTPVPVEVEAEPVVLDAATAQKLGIVANELVTNAFRHGAPPIRVRLDAGRETRMRVEDAGA
jgi:two-component sensor histidine kinase